MRLLRFSLYFTIIGLVNTLLYRWFIDSASASISLGVLLPTVVLSCALDLRYSGDKLTWLGLKRPPWTYWSLLVAAILGGGFYASFLGFLASWDLVSLAVKAVGTIQWSDLLNWEIALIGSIALSEELLFRGFLLSLLMQSFSFRISASVSSVLFASLHLFNHVIEDWLWLFSMGVFMCVIVYRMKTLWYSIAFHFGFNIILFVSSVTIDQMTFSVPPIILSLVLSAMLLLGALVTGQIRIKSL